MLTGRAELAHSRQQS